MLQDFGCVGIADDYSGDRYWLGVFEECRPLSVNDAFHRELSAFLDSLEDNCPDSADALQAIKTHRRPLSGLRIVDTLYYTVEFADTHGLDLDLSITNFMVNQQGGLVAVDIVYGADPEPWCMESR